MKQNKKTKQNFASVVWRSLGYIPLSQNGHF